VHRAGKQMVVKEMFPPEELEALIGALYEVCETQGLNKVEPFAIEVGK